MRLTVVGVGSGIGTRCAPNRTLIDIDHFKAINDTYGHAAGDEVLREFSNILKRNVRIEDSVFRYGGEEFAMVAHGDTIEDIQLFVERILSEVRNTRVVYEDKEISFAFSAGIERVHPKITKSELIKRADAALYFAKNNGRNQVVCFNDEMLKVLK